MLERLGAFFAAIADGTVDFACIGEFFVKCFEKFNANEHLFGIWTAIRAFCDSLGFALPIILTALCITVMLCGHKLIPIERFLFFTVVGYIVGVLGVSPLINKIFALPELVSGLVVAIVAAVLSKYIYHAAVVVAFGYSTFVLFYTDSVFASIATQGQLTLCLIFGLAIGAIALILRKITAIILTSASGSYLLTRVVVAFIVNYESPEAMGGKGWILTLCSVIVLAVVSFIVQFKTRTRY